MKRKEDDRKRQVQRTPVLMAAKLDNFLELPDNSVQKSKSFQEVGCRRDKTKVVPKTWSYCKTAEKIKILK